MYGEPDAVSISLVPSISLSKYLENSLLQSKYLEILPLQSKKIEKINPNFWIFLLTFGSLSI